MLVLASLGFTVQVSTHSCLLPSWCLLITAALFSFKAEVREAVRFVTVTLKNDLRII